EGWPVPGPVSGGESPKMGARREQRHDQPTRPQHLRERLRFATPPRPAILSPGSRRPRVATAGQPANRLVEFPSALLRVGLLAIRACAGTLAVRRFQPEADQVALHGHDGQRYGIPDVKDIAGRTVGHHWKTSLQRPAAPSGSDL